MVDHRADVLQFGAKTQAFEIALVGLGKRAREMGVRFEGGEVFDAEHGFGMDGDGLNGGSLGSGKANRGTESAQGEEFAFFGGEFPVAGELNEAGVGDKVEFTQEFLGGQGFPFRVGGACQTDKGGFQVVETFAVVENAHAENAERGFFKQVGNGSEGAQQILVEGFVGQAERGRRLTAFELIQHMVQCASAPVFGGKAEAFSEEQGLETSTLVGAGSAVK